MRPRRSVYVHILSWLHATCWVRAQLVSTPDGLKSSKQQILCASDQNNGAKVRAALQELSLRVAEGNTLVLPKPRRVSF